jgi:transcription initiation factor TFIIF subunit alpha
MPKYGAGSEYGRDQREEARKKKFGVRIRKYNSDDQPWLLRFGGGSGNQARRYLEGQSFNFAFLLPVHFSFLGGLVN